MPSTHCLARTADARVLDGLEAELRPLAILFDRDRTAAVLKAIGACHRRRFVATPDIVRRLYQTGPA